LSGARCIDADASRAVRRVAIVQVAALASHIRRSDWGAGRMPSAGNKKVLVSSLSCKSRKA